MKKQEHEYLIQYKNFISNDLLFYQNLRPFLEKKALYFIFSTFPGNLIFKWVYTLDANRFLFTSTYDEIPENFNIYKYSASCGKWVLFFTTLNALTLLSNSWKGLQGLIFFFKKSLWTLLYFIKYNKRDSFFFLFSLLLSYF